MIIGVYRRVSGISLRPELHLIGCPVRTGRASRLLELSPARAQLLELAAERLLDSQKRQDEQAFLRDPHNLVQPFRSVLKENRDEVERLVQAALRTPGRRSEATKFLIGFLLSAVIIGAAFIVLHRTGMLSFADPLSTMLRA